jgi:hypothetical protein
MRKVILKSFAGVGLLELEKIDISKNILRKINLLSWLLSVIPSAPLEESPK